MIADRKAFVRKLLAWGRANRREFPWRGERDPFKILVAEVLLQRSRSRTVAMVFEELIGRWPSAEELAAAEVEDIEDVIRPLGLLRRASSLKRMAREIVERGGVPPSVEMMIRLSGVGRYAASATAGAAFNHREPTVDGTSARVYRRYLGLPAVKDSKVDDDLWREVEDVMPARRSQEWNWAVLDLAAFICLPSRPRCEECPLKNECSVGSGRIQESVGGYG